jgi:hypothetical protein
LDGGSARRTVATDTQNKHTQTSMVRVGFESTTPEFEWTKTVHALGRVSASSAGRLLRFRINECLSNGDRVESGYSSSSSAFCEYRTLVLDVDFPAIRVNKGL